jgi:NAD(P)-dependent dehydrogenase (short-subunit alcohol dehydrogenase family)
MTTISSKHVLITGSASGIGRLLAEKMAALGAQVSMWDIDDTCLAGAAAGICAGGGLVRNTAAM